MGSTAHAIQLTRRWPDNLRQLLQERALSTRAFAAQIGLPRGTVTDWWTGTTPRSPRSRLALQAWCQAEGIDVDALLASADIHDLSRERAARQPTTRTSTRGPRGPGGGGAPPPGPPEDDVQNLTREYLTPDELDWFGLVADPFEDDQPDDLFMPKGLAQIESSLVRAIRGRKIVALVGPAGAGKSAMLRRLWAVSEREKRVRLIAPALMDRRRVTLATLTVAILRDLVERDTSSMAAEARAQLLRTTLADQVQAGMYPTLFVDEAHDLRDEALIAIKRLWDSHTLWRQIAIVMVGQPPLAGRLRSDPTLAELTGRTQLIELPAFSPDAVAAYLSWRIARVGGSVETLFSPTALQAIATRADRPMWIHNVAVLAMRQARLVGDQQVVPTHVGRI